MRNGLMAFLALLALALTVGWTAQKPDYDAEFKALQAEYQKEYEAFIKPLMDAKTDAEREKIQLDWDKQPATKYIPKFVSLADKAKGTDAGARSLLFVIQLSQQTGDQKAMGNALDTLVKNHASSPILEQVASNLAYAYGVDEALLNRSLETMAKSPHRKVQAAAKFTIGMRTIQSEKPTDAQTKKALAIFQELKKDYADTPYAQRAEGYIFQAQNLAIGKVAPDFECTDQDGKKFKLSDYRGKVVVVDFWGYW